MKMLLGSLLLFAAFSAAPAQAQSACQPGTYAAPDGDFVVLAQLPTIPAPALRYLFRDGRRGATSDAAAPLACGTDEGRVQGKPWRRVAFRAMAAQGLYVFVYDKRGTGASDGEYTQNFELLAEDAANALAQARGMAAGRFGRAGFFGGSQGGWVAPLAATRTKADFVAVGFGLVASPIEEDREQMVSEVRAAGLGEEAVTLVNRLSKATSGLLLSDFHTG